MITQFDLGFIKFRVHNEVLHSLSEVGVGHIVQGENGIGKTTFFEGVMVPRLRQQGLTVLQLGPDSDVSNLLIRTWCLIIDRFGSFRDSLPPGGFAALLNAPLSSEETNFLERRIRFDAVVIDDYSASGGELLQQFSEQSKVSRRWYLISHEHDSNFESYRSSWARLKRYYFLRKQGWTEIELSEVT